MGIGDTTVQACPYTLNVFDLTTDKILRQYRLRSEDVNQVRGGERTSLLSLLPIGRHCRFLNSYLTARAGHLYRQHRR